MPAHIRMPRLSVPSLTDTAMLAAIRADHRSSFLKKNQTITAYMRTVPAMHPPIKISNFSIVPLSPSTTGASATARWAGSRLSRSLVRRPL